MHRKIYLFAVLAFCISSEAKKIKLVPSHPYIFNLELKFDENKLDDFVVDSFFGTINPESDIIPHCDITLIDIVKAIPIKKMAIIDFMETIDKLELSVTDEDVTSFIANLNYADLSSIGFNAGKVYKNVAKTYFKDRTADLLETLNILGIAPEFSIAYTFGTDEELFNVFRNANLSVDNLVEIGNIVNTTMTVKDVTNVLGLKKINQLYLANFINTKVSSFLIEKGLTEESLLRFLRSFSLSLSDYKNSKFVKTCYNSLTKYKTIAVGVSENEILTNDDRLISKYLNLEKYTILLAEVVENMKTAFSISADNINANKSDNIIRINIDGKLSSFIPETTTYEDINTKLCNYITTEDNVLMVHNAPADVVNDQLIVTKAYNTLFKKGSPLICGQELYGLAAIDRVNTIVFDHFEKEQLQEVAPVVENPDITDAMKEFFENIAGNIDLCKYFGCSNVNNIQEGSIEKNENQSVSVESEFFDENAMISSNENVENKNDDSSQADENQIYDITEINDSDLINEQSQNENAISEHDLEEGSFEKQEQQTNELYSKDNDSVTNSEIEVEAEQTENINSYEDGETNVQTNGQDLEESLQQEDQNQIGKENDAAENNETEVNAEQAEDSNGNVEAETHMEVNQSQNNNHNNTLSSHQEEVQVGPQGNDNATEEHNGSAEAYTNTVATMGTGDNSVSTGNQTSANQQNAETNKDNIDNGNHVNQGY